ncbi:MAG: M20 family metallopeptidase [bacterium]
MIPAELNTSILSWSEAILPQAWQLALSIFNKPELAFHEYFASEALCGFLQKSGFEIETGLGGLDTAFRAVKSGDAPGPRLAFLAEMDALAEMGHACGHHLIGTASAASAVVLVSALGSFSGSIEVIGTPAEEGGGGKVILAREGVFQGIDAALLVHPDKRTEVFKRSLGVAEIRLTFTGRAAHAAVAPESGINALDAVVQTFNAVSMLRQQLPDKTRVHGIITQGGSAPNIIPEKASAVFLARGLTLDQTMEIADQVRECAEGAARSTGASLQVELSRDHMYAPYVPNRPLGEAFIECLHELGLSDDGGPEDEAMGSTDVGNVGLDAPVLHPLMEVPGAESGVHTPEFASIASSQAGSTMLERAVKAMSLAGARVLTDDSLRQRIKEDHRNMLREVGSDTGDTPAAGEGGDSS